MKTAWEKELLTPIDKLFFTLVGILASLILTFLYYWGLRIDSSLYSFVINTRSEPVYYWIYLLLTSGSVVLFGINIAFLVFRVRKYGFPRFTRHAGTGLGTLIGFIASACPVCGSLLLSAIGISAGLAAFPLQGLELKALSLILFAIPLWFNIMDIRKYDCGDASCPKPKKVTLGVNGVPWVLVLLVFTMIVVGSFWEMLITDPILTGVAYGNSLKKLSSDNSIKIAGNTDMSELYTETVKKVLPESGFQSKINLGDSVIRLAENGVIDRDKFETLYEKRGGLPKEFKTVFDKSADSPMLLTQENAGFYLNFLWPLGLSNYMSTNKDSPVNSDNLFKFASTGGWNLGMEKNGGAYFNKFEIVPLTSEQEALVTEVAKNTYRPCCNNSSFFQDCNHGSAMLGLLQLGASQGLTEEELYREALAFNSFWFPQNYIQTALLFKINNNMDWEDVNPKEIMSYKYSAVSPWSNNVAKVISKIPNLLPKQEGGAGCGV